MASPAMVSPMFPVWIDNPRVDSAAMLSAYQSVVRPSDEWYGHLTVDVHKMTDHGVSIQWPPSVKPVTRATPSCFRCDVRQGGYVFRWFHESWKAAYLQAKRQEDAWSPEETAEETARFDAAFQARQPVHQVMMREKMRNFEAQVAAAEGDLRQPIMNLAREAAGASSDDESEGEDVIF